jgi:hypothetical protein
MLRYLVGLLVGLLPLLVVGGLLALAAWRDRRREALVARQIRLTDAIAAEMGAIVAPVVEKPAFRPWQVRMAVPAGRPAMVARILAVTQATLDRIAGAPWEIVLEYQPASGPSVGPGRLSVVPAQRRAA